MARVAITGSSGLLGGALTASLQQDGHAVSRVVRDPAAAGPDDIVWSVRDRQLDPAAFDGIDAVVHFAGEPIGSSRWTSERKRRIRDSRVGGTDLLASTLASLDDPPGVLISGSAVGYYGERGDAVVDEATGPGGDFLAEVVHAWEAAAEPARAAGIRVVHPRTGVVIARGGDLIEKVELPFRLGVGGRVGSGRQYVPWVALDDHVRAVRFLLDHDELAGPFNITAPEPVTNAELTRAIGAVLRRPTLLPIPPFALRIVYGELGVVLGTVSQRAVPRRLLDAGFTFAVPSLDEALRRAFAR